MKKMGLLPLRDLLIFPGTVMPIYVGRPASIATLEEAMNGNKKLLLALQKDHMMENPSSEEDIYEVGVIANILQIIKVQNTSIKVVLEAESRVKINNVFFSQEGSYAIYENLEEEPYDKKELGAIYRKVFSLFEKYLGTIGKYSAEVLINLKQQPDKSRALDIIYSNIDISSAKKQEFLEILNPVQKGYELINIISSELEIIKLEQNIDNKVQKRLNEAQKNYYIREKISTLKEELSDLGEDDEYSELNKKLNDTNLPIKVREKLETEMKRLVKMQPFSAESSVTRTYIETVLDLPWDNFSDDVLELDKVQKILDRDHYGLEDAKNKVLDFLAVKKLNPSMHGSILCLAGPPGIGKTSLVKSIAESMGREFARVSLGGVRDEAEIRGHRRTYVGSMPGKIMKAIKEAGTKNPVILLDEIDKMSNDFKGDPASAMLEVLDPEQNKHFEDHYIDLEFDLSQVFFVATANDLRTVSAPLRDRMEILNLSSYTEFEKINIAKNYLIKQAKNENGLTDIDIKMSDKIIFKIIDEYTREAGVRNLKREIITLFRKLAREVVEKGNNKFNLKLSDVEKYLGKPKFRPEKSRKAVSKLGIVNGLAWTSVGGVTLEVQELIYQVREIFL